MIKLAKITDINEVSVTLMIHNESCELSNCNNQCKKGFVSFLFPDLNNRMIKVSLQNKDTGQFHIVDEQHFFQKTHQKDDVIGLKFCEQHLFKLSLVLYGFPIFCMIFAMMLGYLMMSWINYSADLGGILGLIGGLIVAKEMIKHNLNKIKPEVEFFK